MADPAARRFAPERLLAFSDGVFAIAITLLVIDLHLPESQGSGGQGGPALIQALREMAPKFVVFVFTFLVVGLGWLGHHRKFSYIRSVDETILWLNLLYLMTICLVPFVTSVLNNSHEGVALALYAAVMAASSLLSAGLSLYALRPPFIDTGEMPPATKRAMFIPPVLTALVFLGGGAIGLLGHPSLGGRLLLLILPVNLFFSHWDRRYQR